MSHFLCIRLIDLPLTFESAIDWFVMDSESHKVESGSGKVKELPDILDSIPDIHRHILIAPSSQSILTKVNLPSSQQRHIKQALPFLVEEHLIDPVENMHLAHRINTDSESVSVVGIKAETLSEWLSIFLEMGVALDYLFLDVLCVPYSENQWSLLFEGEKIFLRSSTHQGMLLDNLTAKTLLQLSINERVEAEEEQIQQANLYLSSQAGLSENDSAETLSKVENFRDEISRFIRSENIETENTDYRESISEIMAIQAVSHSHHLLNMLQGEFRASSASAADMRFISKATKLVSAALLIFLMVSLGGGFYLNYKADQYFSSSVDLYREAFPKQRRVNDPVRLVKQRLNGNVSGGTVSDFLPLLDVASQVMSELDAVNLDLTNLRYDSVRGDIIIDLQLDSIDMLDQYKELLVAQGLEVDILNANQSEQFVTGRIQLARP